MPRKKSVPPPPPRKATRGKGRPAPSAPREAAAPPEPPTKPPRSLRVGETFAWRGQSWIVSATYKEGIVLCSRDKRKQAFIPWGDP